MKKEIQVLKQQLEESKQGLQAASRLSGQLEASKKLSNSLKEEGKLDLASKFARYNYHKESKLRL